MGSWKPSSMREQFWAGTVVWYHASGIRYQIESQAPDIRYHLSDFKYQWGTLGSMHLRALVRIRFRMCLLQWLLGQWPTVMPSHLPSITPQLGLDSTSVKKPSASLKLQPFTTPFVRNILCTLVPVLHPIVSEHSVVAQMLGCTHPQIHSRANQLQKTLQKENSSAGRYCLGGQLVASNPPRRERLRQFLF